MVLVGDVDKSRSATEKGEPALKKGGLEGRKQRRGITKQTAMHSSKLLALIRTRRKNLPRCRKGEYLSSAGFPISTDGEKATMRASARRSREETGSQLEKRR